MHGAAVLRRHSIMHLLGILLTELHQQDTQTHLPGALYVAMQRGFQEHNTQAAK